MEPPIDGASVASFRWVESKGDGATSPDRDAKDWCGASRKGALAIGASPRGGAFRAPTVTAAATTTKPMPAAQIFDVASKTLYPFAGGQQAGS